MGEQPGTSEVNRLMAIVYDTWSVNTQAPGGIMRSAALISVAGMAAAMLLSANPCTTARDVTATTARTAAPRRTSRAARARGPAAGSAPSTRDTGSAMASARNGARNAG